MPTTVYADHLEIVMRERARLCIACDALVLDPGQGLPMFEGEVVDDTATEWAGFDCCRECYAIWQDGGAVAINAHIRHLDRMGAARTEGGA